MIEWVNHKFTVELGEPGIIVFTAFNSDNETQFVRFELSHETAIKIAEALLLKGAYVEYQITQAVERMTEFD